MFYLRQSTASQNLPIGPFLDNVDGDTEKSALTIANTDIKLWKAGATSLVSKNSGGATYMSNGVYYAVLDATDSNTLGPLHVFVHVAGALAVKVQSIVLPTNVYDGFFGTAKSFDRAIGVIGYGTVTTGGTTTSIPTSSLAPTPLVSDQFKGRIVIFDVATTTSALRGQATDITASNTSGTLTVSQLTTAPASGDTFIIQ